MHVHAREHGSAAGLWLGSAAGEQATPHAGPSPHDRPAAVYLRSPAPRLKRPSLRVPADYPGAHCTRHPAPQPLIEGLSAQSQRIECRMHRRRLIRLLLPRICGGPASNPPSASPPSSPPLSSALHLSLRHSPANGSDSGTYRCPLPVVRKVCAHAAIFIPAPARTCCRQPMRASRQAEPKPTSQPVRQGRDTRRSEHEQQHLNGMPANPNQKKLFRT